MSQRRDKSKRAGDRKSPGEGGGGQEPGAKAPERKLGYPSEQPRDKDAAHAGEDAPQKPNTDPPDEKRPVDEE